MNDAQRHVDVLHALDDLVAALHRNAERSATMAERAADLRRGLLSAAPLAEVVRQEDRPLIVELITESIRDLQSSGVELRRCEARALRGEGLSIEAIAGLFGVTRQRVSALLRDR